MSKTSEGGPQRLTQNHVNGRVPATDKHYVTWGRSCDHRAVLPLILAVAEHHGFGLELVGPGRIASRGSVCSGG